MLIEITEKVLYEIEDKNFIYQAIEITIWEDEIIELGSYYTGRQSTKSRYFICKRTKDKDHSLLVSKEEFPTVYSMLLTFQKRYDPDGKIVNYLCAICSFPMCPVLKYPNLICRECEHEAKNVMGEVPQYRGDFDGDNPIYIDGKKCWKIYKFGGYVTILDKLDCNNVNEFYSKYYSPTYSKIVELVSQHKSSQEIQDFLSSLSR